MIQIMRLGIIIFLFASILQVVTAALIKKPILLLLMLLSLKRPLRMYSKRYWSLRSSAILKLNLINGTVLHEAVGNYETMNTFKPKEFLIINKFIVEVEHLSKDVSVAIFEIFNNKKTESL